MYEVQKMEPGTPHRGPQGAPRKYPFDKLKPGEGFYAPVAKKRSLSSLACRISKAEGRRISVIQVDDKRVQVVERAVDEGKK